LGHKTQASSDGLHNFGQIRLAHDHALHAGHVALFGGDFEVAVDDTAVAISWGI
jgi:hypothetical protein